VSEPEQIPDDPAATIWDVVVVGTGMGGATAGYALARAGHRVLFLEKGRFLHREADRGDGRIDPYASNAPEARLHRGYWPTPLEGETSFGSLEFFAPLGCGSGGSTALYGAALERLTPADFTPKRNFPDAVGANLPESWPIGYEELEPYYERAEQLYRVRGDEDPLRPGYGAGLGKPPGLSARDQELTEFLRGAGLHPYRVHVGCGFVDGCQECGGALCPRECKSDAGTICLLPALEKFGAKILPECEVTRLVASESAVQEVLCRYRGAELRIRGRVVVLAAGAFMTPVLLLNSRDAARPDGLANRSGMVGRNLMLHTGDFIAVRSAGRLSPDGPKKSLAFNDFYFCEGKKLGTIQSVGIEVDWGVVLGFLRSMFDRERRWWMRLTRPLLPFVALVAAWYFKNAAVICPIVEDLPYLENRVVSDPSAKSGMRFEYTYPEELFRRNRFLRDQLTARLGRSRLAVLSGENNLNFGHACGTCRMGTDPLASVLDRNNRAHELENLYVVDASFFPSSGGANPSLTIAANALRAADAIHLELERGTREGAT
jgi:choline dehydrogenase-like flavoprotein